MKNKGRNSIEETIIEEALTEKELETLLVGFLEALEREQRLGLSPAPTETPKVKGETA